MVHAVYRGHLGAGMKLSHKTQIPLMLQFPGGDIRANLSAGSCDLQPRRL